MSKIDALENELWCHCVRQRAASSEAQAEHWQNDEWAHLRERFLILPAPIELVPAIASALAEWDDIEANLLNLESVRGLREGGAEPADYLAAFAESRAWHLSRNGRPPRHLDICLEVRGIVRNMDWVNLFALVLPGAQPNDQDAILRRARMVVATYYFETIGKAALFPGEMNGITTTKLEARWRLVNPNAWDILSTYS